MKVRILRGDIKYFTCSPNISWIYFFGMIITPFDAITCKVLQGVPTSWAITQRASRTFKIIPQIEAQVKKNNPGQRL